MKTTTPPDRDNLVLTGMPASGKTTVGRAVAEHLGWSFIDLDMRIAEAGGQPIPTLLAARGEAAFRELEREAVQALAGVHRAVIAVGGGALLDVGNRAAAETLGVVVCLTATPEALLERLRAPDAPPRPLLEGPDEEPLHRLLAARRRHYDGFPWRVDTSRREFADTVDAVLAAARLAESLEPAALAVGTGCGSGYSVLVGPGLLDPLGTLVAARGLDRPAVVVTDATVNGWYGGRIRASLAAAGMTASCVEVGRGEQCKSLATVAELYDAFLAAGLDRDGTVIALGGGIVGDTAGFAAATFLRGVALVMVPTTLLAMVDAAIGGKVAVNLPAGKNLVGAFHHPALVVADPTALQTLPFGELKCGLAEVVKAAMIDDPLLFEQLEQDGVPAAGDPASWARLIVRAAGVKVRIVTADPGERDRRRVLNLGHTFAHALERATDHRLAHGEAVAIGLAAAARLGVRLGRAEVAWVERVERLLQRLGLPVAYAGPPPEEVLAAMATDKKRGPGGLRFMVSAAPGRVEELAGVPATVVLAVLQEIRRAHLPPAPDRSARR